MAKSIVIDEIIAEQIAGGAVAEPTNKFVDSDGQPVKVRSMESTYDPLVEGDIIEVPTAYKVLQVKFSDEPDAKAYPCVICKVISLDGSERGFRWFPNSLCKTITPIVDGKRQSKVKTSGTATSKYLDFATVDEAMAFFAGKSIRVADSQVYQVRDYQTKEIRDTHLYKYDFVV